MYNMQTIVPNSSDKNVYSILKVVYQTCHVVFSFDFGFFKHSSSNIQMALNIFSFIKCFGLCILIMNHVFSPAESGRHMIWLILFLINYLINVIALAPFKTDKTMYNFYLELLKIDENLNVDAKLYFLEIKTVILMVASVICNVLIAIAHCVLSNDCETALWISLVILMLMVSLEVLLVSYTFIFYSVYCRLETFLNTLTTTTVHSDFASYQYLYKTIIDIVEKYKSAYDSIYILSLLFKVPGTMSSIYGVVKETLDLNMVPNFGLMTHYASIFESFLILFSPAIIAGMLATQADKIRIILHKKLLDQQDETQIKDIKRFIHYVEARGCRFHVCKVVPLNADLLMLVLSFCATYLIVIIQFTHIQ